MTFCTTYMMHIEELVQIYSTISMWNECGASYSVETTDWRVALVHQVLP